MARNVRVLLIDPNPAESDEALRKLKDSKTMVFSVCAVADLKDGIEATAQHPFDIALVDPGVPGWGSAKSMAELQTNVREMPIVGEAQVKQGSWS